MTDVASPYMGGTKTNRASKKSLKLAPVIGALPKSVCFVGSRGTWYDLSRKSGARLTRLLLRPPPRRPSGPDEHRDSFTLQSHKSCGRGHSAVSSCLSHGAQTRQPAAAPCVSRSRLPRVSVNVPSCVPLTIATIRTFGHGLDNGPLSSPRPKVRIFPTIRPCFTVTPVSINCPTYSHSSNGCLDLVGSQKLESASLPYNYQYMYIRNRHHVHAHVHRTER